MEYDRPSLNPLCFLEKIFYFFIYWGREVQNEYLHVHVYDILQVFHSGNMYFYVKHACSTHVTLTVTWMLFYHVLGMPVTCMIYCMPVTCATFWIGVALLQSLYLAWWRLCHGIAFMTLRHQRWMVHEFTVHMCIPAAMCGVQWQTGRGGSQSSSPAVCSSVSPLLLLASVSTLQWLWYSDLEWVSWMVRRKCLNALHC